MHPPCGDISPVLWLSLPLRLESVANLREHWGRRAARAKRERRYVALALRAQYGSPPWPVESPLRILLTRIAPRQCDGDNLQSSCKACRDAIATWLRMDDGSSLLTWAYAQRRGRVREYGVEIQIEAWYATKEREQ